MSSQSVESLLPRHEAFLRREPVDRPLLLWGEISPQDWALLETQLQPTGLSIQPIVKSTDEVRRYRWRAGHVSA